jgi:leucyl/phenylalanyl-tRNA---protein transferase
VALVHLVARLCLGGYTLLDTQFVTQHLQRFGAIEIPRSEYRRLLMEALRRSAVFQPELPEGGLTGFLQSTTQTS